MFKKTYLAASLVFLFSCAEKRVQPVRKPEPVATPAAMPTPAPVQKEPAAAPAKDGSPTGVIQKYTEELRGIIALNERKEKGKRDQEREQKIAKKVRQFFDFQGLAQMSLEDYWNKITKAERDEYTKLFIGLVEDSYIKRSRDLMGNYQLTYGSEEMSGDQAKVTCRIARDDADIDIVYDLHKKNGSWMIYNINLDSVDLIRNYRSQFNRIIQKSGFKELLNLMRKKLDEGDDVDAGL